MISELCKAFDDTLGMLEDGIRKTPDEFWRSGVDDYLVPVRLVYHILKGLEWLVNDLPREEYLLTRRFKLDWLGPVDSLPGREETQDDLIWARGKLIEWLSRNKNVDADSYQPIMTAIYVLRHTQHHIGELGIIAHLQSYDEPLWK